MGAKVTQYYRVWTVLEEARKKGESVTLLKLKEVLNVKEVSIPVYIHELKKFFKAEIESIKEGNKVVGYKLLQEVNIPEYRRNNSTYVPKKEAVVKPEDGQPDGTAPILDKDNDLVVMNDQDLADLRESLAIDSTDRYTE
jgi:hypothetical protein